jgi:hypothetical protein
MDQQEQAMRNVLSAHKVGNAIIPLVKAIESNKRTRDIENICLSDCVAHVVQVSTQIMLDMKESGVDIDDSNIFLDKLMNVLSRLLANEMILYGNRHLDIFVDEIKKVFVEHEHLLRGDLVGDVTQFKDLNENTETEPRETLPQAVAELIVSSITELVQPVWLFHNNLYVSGFIDLDTLSSLNSKVSKFLILLTQSIHKETGGGSSHLDASLFLMSCRLCAVSLDGFQKKLIKKSKDIEDYIENPLLYLDKIKGMFFVNYSSVSKETKNVLDSLGLN